MNLLFFFLRLGGGGTRPLLTGGAGGGEGGGVGSERGGDGERAGTEAGAGGGAGFEEDVKVEDLVEDRTTMQKLTTDGTTSPPVIYSGLPREGGEYYGLVSETHPVSNGDLPEGLGDWDRR